MMFDVVSLALPQIQAGRVRPLAVSAKERVAVLPDVPTLIELGMDAEVGAWFGMLGPASTSPQAVAWLNREATKVFSVPETRNRFVQQGAAMPLGTPESFGQFIQTNRTATAASSSAPASSSNDACYPGGGIVPYLFCKIGIAAVIRVRHPHSTAIIIIGRGVPSARMP